MISRRSGSRLPDGLTPRLLSRDQAVAYCGISAGQFQTHVACHVPPIAIGRRLLWDVRRIDRWLDELSGLTHPTASVDKRAVLEALNADCDAGRKRRRP